MSRRRFSEREVLEIIVCRHNVRLLCYRCGELLLPDDAEREHIHELALGGRDHPENCVYSHKACHAIVTNGTPATSAGSSKNRIAKTKGTRAEKFAVVKLDIDKPREKRRGFGGRLVKG